MIIQPDFPEHWKTRLLVELTGDESAPMCVVRLWSHCQHNRRSFFPDMTSAQLSSICHWGTRKPACHVALVKAGFVDKLKPRGFTAHQWNEHNAQLLQKWSAGAKGGRPPGLSSDQNAKTFENPATEVSADDHQQHGKSGQSAKPDDNRPLTAPKPDQIRLDQIRPEKIDERDPIRSDGSVTGPDSDSSFNVSGGIGSGVAGLVSKLTANGVGFPPLEEALAFAKTRYGQVWDKAEHWVTAWHRAKTESRWRDGNGRPIAHWDRNLIQYVDKCWNEDRKGGTAEQVRNWNPY